MRKLNLNVFPLLLVERILFYPS